MEKTVPAMTQEQWDAMTRLEQNAWRTRYGTWPADLPGGLLSHFRGTRERVAIQFNDGHTERGYIGMTTGWRPAWLLLARTTSSGSSNLLDARDIARLQRVTPTRSR